ncbi:MAG: TetR/AcrR family transcriptional regulator [Kofleriaceae bacterium]
MVRHETAETRRAQLFQAALEVCAENGYHETTVDEIAARCGLSKGSLYYHFRSKEDLFLSALEAMVDQFASLLAQASERETASEALVHSTEFMIAQVEAHPKMGLATAEFYLLSLRRPEFRKRIKAYYDKLIEVGVQVVRRGIESGEFDPSLDSLVATRVLFLGCDGVALMQLVLNEPEHFSGVTRAFVARTVGSFLNKGNAK